jgi:UV DNA damage repair endonuclease
MKKRIGFCCKWLNSRSESKDKGIRAEERSLNTSSTTVAWLNRQTRSQAEDKLWSIAKHNLASVKRVLERVATLDPSLHMMRISSDLLPVYTEPTWSYFWQQQDVRDFCAKEFAEIGNLAGTHDIRLSFHPGQFCVLASENDDVVRRSIEEFEYHVDMARWMGYGSTWHDHGFKINVHIAGSR